MNIALLLSGRTGTRIGGTGTGIFGAGQYLKKWFEEYNEKSTN